MHEFIKQMADPFVMLIRIGAVFRAVYCLVRIGINEEEAGKGYCCALYYSGVYSAD